EEVDDGYGNTYGQWVPQFERDACILPSKGGETVIAARLQSVQPALIIVRYDVETATINAAWRLIEIRSGTAYNIRTVADIERRGRFITMLWAPGVATWAPSASRNQSLGQAAMTPSKVGDHFRVSETALEALLVRASETGARRALQEVGLEGKDAAEDIRDLRSLLAGFRLARRTAVQTTVRILTTGILIALMAGIAIKLKLFGPTP